jgi:hypothetical protein
VPLGLWKEITLEDLAEGSEIWQEGFCLKPLCGSRCKDVVIWHPSFKKAGKKHRGMGGISSKTKIRETLARQERMFLQKFIPPMKNEKGENYIYRIFFGYDPEEKKWVYLGGLWASRPNFKIHGANDATFGPVLRER